MTSFIHKYSPKKLDDFYLKDDLKLYLKASIENDNMNIMLIGDTCTGKTNLIKVLINEYYNNNYNDDDILFINSIKDNGINYFRNELKVFCQIKSLNKKIIVLDDIDELNDISQQILRTYIDKYENIIFLCSCSNILKIIEGLQSRLICINLIPLSLNESDKIIDTILQKEDIKMSDHIKNILKTICNNNIKLIINYLEKIKLLDNELNEEIIYQICNNISFNELEMYFQYCKTKEIKLGFQLLLNKTKSGYSVMDILDSLFMFIKNTLIFENNKNNEIIKILCKYITIFYNIHEDEIELLLLTNEISNLF